MEERSKIMTVDEWARALKIAGDPVRLKILLALYAAEKLRPEAKY